MTTAVSICSNALLLLGDEPMADFDEGTTRATVAANLWPSVRDAVLRARPWNCAKKRAQLARIADAAPGFGFAYAFQKPADWLRTLQVGEDDSGIHYADDAGRILASVDPLPLIYVFRNDNPATYDAMLVDALTLTMAARMAYPITRSATAASTFQQLADRQVKFAASVDAQDEPPQNLGGVSLLGARY